MQTKVSRRKFLTLGAGALLGAAFVATPTYLHLQDESRQLVVERVQIPIRNLSPALEGFTIVQLSDIHLEPYTKADLIRQAVEIANSLQPGLVVLTGDYVWRKLEAIFDLTPILARLNAQHGVFSIMGNHDIWTDVNVVRTAFQEQGLPVLENQGVPLTVNRAPLYLAGLDDGWSGQPDLEAALDGAPAGAPVVLLPTVARSGFRVLARWSYPTWDASTTSACTGSMRCGSTPIEGSGQPPNRSATTAPRKSPR
jgi:predicted MPP superfamily phosphohydrolase